MAGSEDNLPQYAELLAEARKKRGWTADRTAERLACGKSTLRNAERGRGTPKVFLKIAEVFPEEAPAILLAWSQERPQSDGQPLGVLPSLGNVMTVGSGLLGDLEDRHNYIRIGALLQTVESPALFIGSPYLRYWLESPRRCRLARLLEQLPQLRAEVVLFASDGPETDTAAMASTLTAVAVQHPMRLVTILSDRRSDFSYITYEFKGDADEPLRRLLLGLQIVEYEERPFLELISPANSPDLVTERVLRFHGELLDEFEP